jgi:hypothetical protein
MHNKIERDEKRKSVKHESQPSDTVKRGVKNDKEKCIIFWECDPIINDELPDQVI